MALLLGLLGALAAAQLGRRAEEASRRERRQTLRQVMYAGPRGQILDRQGRVMAASETWHDVVLHLGRVRAEMLQEEARGVPPAGQAVEASAAYVVAQAHFERVQRILGRGGRLDPARLHQHVTRQRTLPFPLLERLTPEEAARLRTEIGGLGGAVEVRQRTQRTYPHKQAAAHVLGRVRPQTVHTPVGPEYPITNYIDWVGDWGAERVFDDQLRGRPGSLLVRVDAAGWAVEEISRDAEPVPGADVVLSLDLELQRAAADALRAGRAPVRGSAVALSVQTGEVLALVSLPDYDVNAVSPILPPAVHAQIEAEGAWLNRATQGLYPPGSSFKVYTTISGLRSGARRSADEVYCPGYYEVAGHRFRCHREEGHGKVTLRGQALAQSCNVFAFTTGLAAGPDVLASTARAFHFHEPTGIELPFESSGMLVPDATWKKAQGRGNWTAIDTANLAIGQGDLRITPLQAACAIASLARRETLTIPTLRRDPHRSPTGDRPREPLQMSAGDYAALLDAMRAVVESGIGFDAQVPGISVAGKTGTAQVEAEGGMRNVAWFVAFAPVERPEIAVAVAIEGAEVGVEFAGAEHAAPVVRELIGTYFDRRAAH